MSGFYQAPTWLRALPCFALSCAFCSAAVGGVPLIETPTGLFAVSVRFNKKTLLMDVDTGSTGTVIDPVAGRQAKIKPRGKTTIYTYTGVVPARTAVSSVTLDKFTSNRHPCVLAPLNALAAHAEDDKVMGIVGVDLLRKSGSVLDFGDFSLETPGADAGSLPATPPRFPMPIEYSDVWGPMLRVRIDGHEFLALIDTGCIQSFVSPDVSAAGKGELLRAADGQPYMVAEKIEFHNPDVGTLEVGHRPLLVDGEDRPVYAAEHVRPKVYLGLDLIIFLEAQIDFRHNLIYFAMPDAEHEPRFDHKNRD